ncbi:MAG: hypothetical protein Q7R51_00150 [bacterium]|nr:hypothetical protein [bacterium]
MKKISWDKSIWFFDIDDTLIDTAGLTQEASVGIFNAFQSKYNSEKAHAVVDSFNDIFNLMLAGYRVKTDIDWQQVPGGKEAFEKLVSNVEACQVRVKSHYGAAKKWSREVFIKIAADRLGLQYSPELVHEAADAYWITLTEQTTVFSSALILIKQIKEHKRPIYLITSSDARLRLGDDRQFDYDPTYSEGLKRERIELLREKGIKFNALSIGDPEDKPHLDFFQKGIKIAESDLDSPIDFKNAIMLGDSFAGDLQTPKEKMGFGLVVLFQKGRKSTEVIDPHQITTGNLFDVAKYLTE